MYTIEASKGVGAPQPLQAGSEELAGAQGRFSNGRSVTEVSGGADSAWLNREMSSTTDSIPPPPLKNRKTEQLPSDVDQDHGATQIFSVNLPTYIPGEYHPPLRMPSGKSDFTAKELAMLPEQLAGAIRQGIQSSHEANKSSSSNAMIEIDLSPFPMIDPEKEFETLPGKLAKALQKSIQSASTDAPQGNQGLSGKTIFNILEKEVVSITDKRWLFALMPVLAKDPHVKTCIESLGITVAENLSAENKFKLAREIHPLIFQENPNRELFVACAKALLAKADSLQECKELLQKFNSDASEILRDAEIGKAIEQLGEQESAPSSSKYESIQKMIDVASRLLEVASKIENSSPLLLSTETREGFFCFKKKNNYAFDHLCYDLGCVLAVIINACEEH